MIRPVKILKAGFLPFVFLFACRQTTVQDEDDPDPNYLRIVAQFKAGINGLATSWKYTITGDGKVEEEIDELYKEGTKKKQITLSKEDLADILAKFREADFQSLRKKYPFPANHTSMLRLAITQNKKTQEVVLHTPEFQSSWLTLANTRDKEAQAQEAKEVRRFLRVWSEILRKAPSPNPEQTPESYLR